MRARAYWRAVTVDEPGLLDRLLAILAQHGLRYCVIGDQAVNAYAERREVLGVELPVASVADVLQGKVWAASDPTRRASKRQKDLADIARLLESYPELTARVPDDLRARLFG